MGGRAHFPFPDPKFKSNWKHCNNACRSQFQPFFYKIISTFRILKTRGLKQCSFQRRQKREVVTSYLWSFDCSSIKKSTIFTF